MITKHWASELEQIVDKSCVVCYEDFSYLLHEEPVSVVVCSNFHVVCGQCTCSLYHHQLRPKCPICRQELPQNPQSLRQYSVHKKVLLIKQSMQIYHRCPELLNLDNQELDDSLRSTIQKRNKLILQLAKENPKYDLVKQLVSEETMIEEKKKKKVAYRKEKIDWMLESSTQEVIKAMKKKIEDKYKNAQNGIIEKKNEFLFGLNNKDVNYVSFEGIRPFFRIIANSCDPVSLEPEDVLDNYYTCSTQKSTHRLWYIEAVKRYPQNFKLKFGLANIYAEDKETCLQAVELWNMCLDRYPTNYLIEQAKAFLAFKIMTIFEFTSNYGKMKPLRSSKLKFIIGHTTSANSDILMKLQQQAKLKWGQISQQRSHKLKELLLYKPMPAQKQETKEIIQ